MSAKSIKDHYGSVAVTIHWLSVFLILILIGSGYRAGDIEDAAAKAAILKVHMPIGSAVLLLTLGRIGWWLFADKKPDAVSMPPWQDRLSRAVHILFYILILGTAASGIGMIALSGAGPIIFSGSVTALPDFWDYPPRMPHRAGAGLIFFLFIIHAGAALYHQFVKRDGLLGRMWYKK
ncbi:MAG: cytochrome b/b6 domain-containing protein [Parasphingorhabdus sp.]|uniref:cytochrome b n=1 Tax=Parasphingorhabdus sp. TaxID=2709688 RepID=UPI00329A3392